MYLIFPNPACAPPPPSFRIALLPLCRGLWAALDADPEGPLGVMLGGRAISEAIVNAIIDGRYGVRELTGGDSSNSGARGWMGCRGCPSIAAGSHGIPNFKAHNMGQNGGTRVSRDGCASCRAPLQAAEGIWSAVSRRGLC